jgi:hypothetical protein
MLLPVRRCCCLGHSIRRRSAASCLGGRCTNRSCQANAAQQREQTLICDRSGVSPEGRERLCGSEAASARRHGGAVLRPLAAAVAVQHTLAHVVGERLHGRVGGQGAQY